MPGDRASAWRRAVLRGRDHADPPRLRLVPPIRHCHQLFDSHCELAGLLSGRRQTPRQGPYGQPRRARGPHATPQRVVRLSNEHLHLHLGAPLLHGFPHLALHLGEGDPLARGSSTRALAGVAAPLRMLRERAQLPHRRVVDAQSPSTASPCASSSPASPTPLPSPTTIFSDSVLVVMASVVRAAIEPARHVFHVVTAPMYLPAFRVWFARPPTPLDARVQLLAISDFPFLNASSSLVLAQIEAREKRGGGGEVRQEEAAARCGRGGWRQAAGEAHGWVPVGMAAMVGVREEEIREEKKREKRKKEK